MIVCKNVAPLQLHHRGKRESYFIITIIKNSDKLLFYFFKKNPQGNLQRKLSNEKNPNVLYLAISQIVLSWRAIVTQPLQKTKSASLPNPRLSQWLWFAS